MENDAFLMFGYDDNYQSVSWHWKKTVSSHPARPQNFKKVAQEQERG